MDGKSGREGVDSAQNAVFDIVGVYADPFIA
jgi:hypothetical protein